MRKTCWLLGLLGSFVFFAACKYDLDKVYRYDPADAAIVGRDAGVDGGGTALPDKLIELYKGAPFVNEACQVCANKSCAAAEKACRKDPSCAAFTACVAESVDPEKLSTCRGEHADWCADDIIARGLGGPFYTCVFRDTCPQQCSTNSDWSCLGKFTWGSTAEKSVRARLRFYDALDGAPAAGISVKVCGPSDAECANPSSTKTTDADGAVALDLPTPLRSFRGYLRLEGSTWYPTIVQFGYPIARETVIPVPIVTERNVNASIAISQVSPDPTRGQLQLRMFGCAGVPMRDVTFASSKADANSRTWYYDGQTVQFGLTKTTTFGNGGIINAGDGLNDVTATLDGKVVAKASATVRPGFLTIVILAPLDSSQSD